MNASTSASVVSSSMSGSASGNSGSSFAPLLKPITQKAFGFWEAHHLLNRAGFGGSADQIRLLAEWGPEKAVDHLVHFTGTTPEPIKSDQFDSTIMAPLTAEEREIYRRAREGQREDIVEQFRQRRQERQRADRKQIREIQKWWFTRMIETSRPLEEKMTLFFHGHFATGYRKIENSYHIFMQNQLFRKFATGNFGDLVFQIIRDPAMIAYLDNNRSHKQAPNENLARELMELFTLGEGIVYTEVDIKEGARALTGYTFNNNQFVFNKGMHDAARKTIFGRTGTFTGDDFAKLILSRPEVSEFISWKLYRFFVNDLPNGPDATQKAFIRAMAKKMRDSKYELAPVLETVFRSRHFYDETNRAAQIKSPVQLVVQAVRSLKTPVLDVNVLVEACELMGQTIFEPPNVKGWEGGRSWINTSTLFMRQNILTHLLTGRMPYGYQEARRGSEFDPMPLIKDLSKGANGYELKEVVDYLTQFCFGQECSEQRRKTLVEFGKSNGGRVTPSVLVGLLCLITAMPEYDLC